MRLSSVISVVEGLDGTSYRPAAHCLMSFVHSICLKRPERGRGAVDRYKGVIGTPQNKKLTLYPWFLLYYSDAMCLNTSRGMAPINLDDIIQYRPPAKEPHFKPLQAPGSHARIHSLSSSDRPAPAYPFLPSQHWRSSLPFSGHTPYLQSHSHSSRETKTLLALNELAEEVAIDCSDEFDMDLLNANSGRDANVAVSSVCPTNRDLGDDVSCTGLGLGQYNKCHDGTWWPSF